MIANAVVLKKFVLEKAKEKKMSLRKISADIGISHSYLSQILNGKKPLDVILGNKIADYFDVPRISVYEMAGWLNLYEDEEFLERVKEYTKKNPDLIEIIDSLLRIRDEKERKRVLKLLKAGLEK